MSKQIQITMPDNSVWGVPAELVAKDRGDYYAAKEGEDSGKAEYAISLEDDDELLDWAANNMNWNDVVHSAIMIRPGKVDYQEGWVNGKKRVAGSA